MDGTGEPPGGLRLMLLDDSQRAPLRRADSIPIDESALCLDCQVLFNVRNRACPKCDGEPFWLVANWRAARIAASA